MSAAPSPSTSGISALWGDVIDVWTQDIFGFSVGQLVVATLILAVGWLARAAIAKIVLGALRHWAAQTSNKLDDRVVASLIGPTKLIPIIIALFVAERLLDLEPAVQALADTVVKSLIAVVIFWGLFNAVRPLMHLATPLRAALGDEAMEWLQQGLRFLAIFIGAATVLELWGIPVGPIIAGLGIFGVAVALGAQDLFKNLIAGLSILVEERFSRGDWILVDGLVEGTVEKIGFRSTHIRRFDKSPVYVPNTDLADNAVTNFTRMTYRRIRWVVGLEYRTTADQLRRIQSELEKHIETNPDFASPPDVTTFVRIDAFSASSVDILIYAFTNTTRWVEYMTIKQDFALTVKDIVERAGAGFAFPSSTVYLEAGDEPPRFYPNQRRRKSAKPKSVDADETPPPRAAAH